MPKKTNKEEELVADLQRLRADFENYHKRIAAEKTQLADLTKAATIMKLLPVIDTIERAVAHVPAELADNKWAQGVVALGKNLDQSLADLGLARILAAPGTAFSPELHEAVMMDESEGEHEVVSEELRAGYAMGEQVVRPSMVKVTHQ